MNIQYYIFGNQVYKVDMETGEVLEEFDYPI